MEKYRNHYQCPNDGEAWSDESHYTNNDRCPKCNSEIEPHHSEDLSLLTQRQMKDAVVLSMLKTPAGRSIPINDLKTLVDAALDALGAYSISAEALFNPDIPEDAQVQAVPFPWLEPPMR